MTVFLYIITGGLLALLVFVASAQPAHTSLSLFELRRREEAKDKKAAEARRREELLAQLGVMRAPLLGLLLVAVAFLFVVLFEWRGGVVAAAATALLYPRLARLGVVRKLSGKLYARLEGKLLTFAAKRSVILRLLGGKAQLQKRRGSIGSREELMHALEGSPVFSEGERRLIKSALRFKEQRVKDIMTPEADIVSVKHTELLGPLVLDDLHKTGHTIFPVMKGGDIVGLLDSSDHVALKSKESVQVRSVMHVDVHKISQDASLDEALKALVEAKQQLFIVVDKNNQPVGLITLGDVVRALTDWKRG